MSQTVVLEEYKERMSLSLLEPVSSPTMTLFGGEGSSYSILAGHITNGLPSFKIRTSGSPSLMVGPPDWINAFGALVTKQTVVFTMYEQANMPVAWYDTLNQARAVIVPSYWGLTQMAGFLKVPIRVCPLGTRLTHPVEKPEGAPFVFSTIAGYNGSVKRKCLDLIIQAFEQNYDRLDGAVLRIRSKPSETRPKTSCPGISFIDEWLQPEAMDRFISETDCGIVMTTGEGFCLPIAQYHSAGVPVIAPTFGPLGELFEIPYDLRVDGKPCFRSNETAEGIVGIGFEPGVDQLQHCLLRARSFASKEPLYWKQLGRSLVRYASTRYSEEAFVYRLRQILREMKLLA